MMGIIRKLILYLCFIRFCCSFIGTIIYWCLIEVFPAFYPSWSQHYAEFSTRRLWHNLSLVYLIVYKLCLDQVNHNLLQMWANYLMNVTVIKAVNCHNILKCGAIQCRPHRQLPFGYKCQPNSNSCCFKFYQTNIPDKSFCFCSIQMVEFLEGFFVCICINYVNDIFIIYQPSYKYP